VRRGRWRRRRPNASAFARNFLLSPAQVNLSLCVKREMRPFSEAKRERRGLFCFSEFSERDFFTLTEKAPPPLFPTKKPWGPFLIFSLSARANPFPKRRSQTLGTALSGEGLRPSEAEAEAEAESVYILALAYVLCSVLIRPVLPSGGL